MNGRGSDDRSSDDIISSDNRSWMVDVQIIGVRMTLEVRITAVLNDRGSDDRSSDNSSWMIRVGSDYKNSDARSLGDENTDCKSPVDRSSDGRDMEDSSLVNSSSTIRLQQG